MKGDGIDLFDERLKREKDPKVRDRLRMIILLEEGYRQREVAKIMRTTERTIIVSAMAIAAIKGTLPA